MQNQVNIGINGAGRLWEWVVGSSGMQQILSPLFDCLLIQFVSFNMYQQKSWRLIENSEKIFFLLITVHVHTHKRMYACMYVRTHAHTYPSCTQYPSFLLPALQGGLGWPGKASSSPLCAVSIEVGCNTETQCTDMC